MHPNSRTKLNPNPELILQQSAESNPNADANHDSHNRLGPISAPPFLTKTYALVDDPETDEIISWNKDGDGFVVWNPTAFANHLLPVSFKHNNLSSFVRQLNTYGFRKIVPDRWEFCNDFFRRGEKYLLNQIRRRKTVPSGSIKPSTASGSKDCPNTPTNSSDDRDQAASSASSSHLHTSHRPSSPSSPSLNMETERLKKENMTLVSELSCLRKLCSDLVLYIQKHTSEEPSARNNIESLARIFRSNGRNVMNVSNKNSNNVQLVDYSSGDCCEDVKPGPFLLAQGSHVPELWVHKQSHLQDSCRSPPMLFGVPLHSQKRMKLGLSDGEM